MKNTRSKFSLPLPYLALVAFVLAVILVMSVQPAKAQVYDFERAEALGLPPTYRFEQVEQTYFGKLNGACAGEACPKQDTYVVNFFDL